jgi:hypothetical protein
MLTKIGESLSVIHFISIWKTIQQLSDIWFTAEAHFHLNGYVNKQNMKLFITTLQGMGVNIVETFFQQDGARPHTASAILHFEQYFHIGVISNQYPGQFGNGWSWHHTCWI